ncbi:hypothetical protein PSN45_003814 [Yamadazyma tenuis]|uniref:uncharacterized protein n=1 Tax=Candida tenuis TaxID=2315449 RepID=UPI0027A54B7F|nr:hypothetical protein PSN45_003814 [Yamadazyma tenuis]
MNSDQFITSTPKHSVVAITSTAATAGCSPRPLQVPRVPVLNVSRGMKVETSKLTHISSSPRIPTISHLSSPLQLPHRHGSPLKNQVTCLPPDSSSTFESLSEMWSESSAANDNKTLGKIGLDNSSSFKSWCDYHFVVYEEYGQLQRKALVNRFKFYKRIQFIGMLVKQYMEKTNDLNEELLAKLKVLHLTYCNLVDELNG